MRTSLNLLRATNACTGGFGRQASFWTVRPRAKAIEYPIWMVGLIGNYDDMSWAINNSLIVDEAEFAELKARTFWPMFQQIFWSVVNADFILRWSQKKAGDFIRDALQEGLKIRNAEEAQAWITKYSRFKVSQNLFEKVVNHPAWTDAQQYLCHLIDVVNNEKMPLCLEHEQNPFNLDSHVPGHDTRTMKVVKTSSSVRRTTARRRDDEADDEEPRANKMAERIDPAKSYYFELPRSQNGRIISKGEAFAYVILNEDPWPVALQFLLDNNVPKTIGSKVNLSKVSPDGIKPPQFAASLHLNDPRTIFILMHLLQGQDFDLLKAIGLEQQSNSLRRVMTNYGNGENLEDIDEIMENPGRWQDTHEKVCEAMTDARERIALNGPTNNAIRERAIAQPRETVDGDAVTAYSVEDEEEDSEESESRW